MSEDVPLRAVEHVRDSSRLNAQTLRKLADESPAHATWLLRRADEIDQFAVELDRYLTHVEEHG
jgi:hypothetical protein